MINAIKRIFGLETETNFAQLVNNGAMIIDVRSKGEYAVGHIQGSINIPVNTLNNNLSKLKENRKPIITCCASGMRSAQAKTILKSNGFTEVYNGGGWTNLQTKIK